MAQPGGDVRNMKFLNDFIADQELIDLPLLGGAYTWSNKQTDPLLCRLDRFLVCTAFDAKFSTATQTALIRTISDHNAILFDLVPTVKAHSSFRIENHWLEHPDFVKMVEIWWNSMDFVGAPGYILFRKLQNLKYFIKAWSRITFGNVRKEEEELEKKIGVLNLTEENTVLSTTRLGERAELLKSLEQVKCTRARMAFQRAKVKGFKEGDKNTQFFHKIASGKRRRNCITKLEVNGVDVFNQDVIKKEIQEYYTNLFTANSLISPSFDNMQFRSIDEVQRGWLERNFEEEEMHKAIKKCGANKAPGPDGFNLEFYKACWETLKKDILAALNEFHATGNLDRRLNVSFMKLIPKKEDSATVRDFRPLSLISSFYKILCKLLAERMKEVMPCLISNAQGAFIKNRQILDGVLVANELIDSRLRQQVPGIICKIDMQKAFDNVNWPSLFAILEKNGFGMRWICWIKWCVTQAQFSILINGEATNLIKPSKGIRQGDPLSPFLFLLVVEVLSLLLNNAAVQSKLNGFSVKEGGTSVTHLQFADDTMIFLDASVVEVRRLLIILALFEILTGLHLNLEKSTMISIGADQMVNDLAMELGCRIEYLPVTYLGMPIGSVRRSELIWEVIIQRMQKKLAPWKRKFLNKAGRVVLIKNSLESLAVYFMSLLHIPASVEKRLNTIMRKFLWGEDDERRKMSWVSFKKICKPKKKGGLGIRSLRLVNKSMLAKWHVRYSKEKSAFWRKIVCEKSMAQDDCLLPLQVRDSVGRSMWFDILREHKVFSESVTVQIKNGESIRFLQDSWCIPISFRLKYPRLYRISSQKMEKVCEFFNNTWNFQFTRTLDPAESIDLLEMKHDLRAVRLIQGEEDILEGDTTAKAIYSKLTETEPDWDGHKLAESKFAPPKVLFLIWAALHESIPTRHMLQYRGVEIQSNSCLFCNSEVETLEHLFMQCREVSKLWDYFLNSLRVKWVMPAKFKAMLISWRLEKTSNRVQLVWHLLPFAICWEVWNERNKRNHGGRAKTEYELQIAIKQWIHLWSSSTDVFSHVSVSQILLQWETILNL